MMHHSSPGSLLLFACALLLYPGPADASNGARATEELRLSPEEALERAVESSIELENARIRIGMAERAAESDWNRFLPDVQAGGSVSRSLGTDSQLPWSTAASGSLSLSLSPATFIVPDEHEAERRRRLLQREDSYWELRRNVLSRYYRLLSEEANLELTRESVAAARRRWQEAQRRYEQGRVSDFDVLQARVQYENARPELSELEAGYRQQLRAFGRLLGLDPDREIALSASMPDILFDRGAGELRTRFVEGHTSVEQERLDIEQIDLALRRNRLSLWPSLSTRLSYGYANADPFAKELSFDERWSGSGRVELSLSVPLDPLLPGSSRRREARDLEDQLRIARNELRETRAATAAGIETAVTQIENARERITALEQSAELASRAYELAEQRYEAGATDRTTLEDAELERERARVALLEQRLAFATGLIDLEYHLRAELGELPW